MALRTISTALSSGIKRNLAVSELKHEAKLDDLKRELAVAQIQRKSHYGQKLTEARITHATWLSSLNPEGVQCYQQSLADIEAIVTPAPTTT